MATQDISSFNKFVPQTLSEVVESGELELSLSHNDKRNLERKSRKESTDFKRNNEDDITVLKVVTAVESKCLDKKEVN